MYRRSSSGSMELSTSCSSAFTTDTEQRSHMSPTMRAATLMRSCLPDDTRPEAYATLVTSDFYAQGAMILGTSIQSGSSAHGSATRPGHGGAWWRSCRATSSRRNRARYLCLR